MQKTDFLVIGAGIAGLTAAHLLSEKGSVTVVTKGELKQGNTYWAQGGIAAVMSKDDSFESHINDTLEVGCHHNDEHAVRYLVEHGPKAIRFLQEIGVKFQEEPALEAGHSFPRVMRTSDFTGRDILDKLTKIVQKNKAIHIIQKTEAVELIVREGRCDGVFIRPEDKTEVHPLMASHTILATGGLGQLFGRTTNTLGSGGDGIALAIDAGVALKDLEFVQFHPTAFAKPEKGRYFLLSEALRGFGAKIVNHKGESFLSMYHPKEEMAPRDVLSRAVYFEIMNGPVYLSMRHLDEGKVKKRFPNIYKWVKKQKLDLAKDLIPVTPVAHYACGGIEVNIHSASSLHRLYAVGEVACTGIHGANRLASNSLLEAVVFAQALAAHLQKQTDSSADSTTDILPEFPLIIIEDIAQVKAYSQRIGSFMWEHVGIVRTQEGLLQARREVATIPARDYRIQHRQKVCDRIIEACLARPDSLGAHHITSDII